MNSLLINFKITITRLIVVKDAHHNEQIKAY